MQILTLDIRDSIKTQSVTLIQVLNHIRMKAVNAGAARWGGVGQGVYLPPKKSPECLFSKNIKKLVPFDFQQKGKPVCLSSTLNSAAIWGPEMRLDARRERRFFNIFWGRSPTPPVQARGGRLKPHSQSAARSGCPRNQNRTRRPPVLSSRNNCEAGAVGTNGEIKRKI